MENPVAEFLKEHKNIAFSKKRLGRRLNLQPKSVKYYIAKASNTYVEQIEIKTETLEEQLVGNNGSYVASCESSEMIKMQKPIIRRVLGYEVGYGKHILNVYKWN
jgi:hypothetical protein